MKGMTTNRKAALVVVAAATLGASGTALASQPNIFGGPGNQPTLAPNCARTQMFVTPAGKTWNGSAQHTGKKYVFEITSVMGGQIKCLIHRVMKLEQPKPDTCFAQAGPVPATAQDKGDKFGYYDTRGLNALDAWAKRLALCEAGK
jgi:hypothetical protein